MEPSPSHPSPPSTYTQPGTPAGRPKTSAAAIASLVCGIVGCVPLVTSLAAIVLGIVGLRRTRDPQYTGRGLAIAGLVLGSIGVIGWASAGGIAWSVYQASKPAAAVAQQFTAAMAQGDVSTARTLCDTSIGEDQLTSVAEAMSGWGPLVDLTLSSRNVETVNGVTTWELGGVATFAQGGNRPATFTLRKVADGYEVLSFSFE